jgi:hypothetical protein
MLFLFNILKCVPWVASDPASCPCGLVFLYQQADGYAGYGYSSLSVQIAVSSVKYVGNIAVSSLFSSLMFVCPDVWTTKNFLSVWNYFWKLYWGDLQNLDSVYSSNLLLEKQCSEMLSNSDGNIWFYSNLGQIKFLFIWVFFLCALIARTLIVLPCSHPFIFAVQIPSHVLT